MPPAALILASASPQRRTLLAQLGRPFTILPPTWREPPTAASAGHSPRAWALALAHAKARCVADQLPHPTPATVILGADTIVVCRGTLLGKPADEADARRMLLMQAGAACEVITGVCLLTIGPGSRNALPSAAPMISPVADCANSAQIVARRLSLDVTRVYMRSDAAAIERYIQTGEWRDKAGAYGIQGPADALIERIEGSFSNVVGLPLELLTRLMTDP
ncbi:MAG: Maf family protein [Phycisphaerales bacterium]|nr:Maf family protein [Phycisphaerales bacterium]